MVQHVVIVEKGVIAKADRVSQKPPKRVPLLRRIHLPVVFAELRFIRLKSPIPIDNQALRGKEEALAELRKARERSLAFLQEMKHRDLQVYCWAHPALGMLNMYEWIRFLAAHQNRHTKQIREITDILRQPFLANLRKPIARLQK